MEQVENEQAGKACKQAQRLEMRSARQQTPIVVLRHLGFREHPERAEREFLHTLAILQAPKAMKPAAIVDSQ